MSSKRTPTAALTIQRPPTPVTSSQLLEALAPLLQLLNLDPKDVSSVHVTHTSVRVQVVPYSRGKRLLDSMVRVTYPVVYDPED